jgi:hypothetical protein
MSLRSLYAVALLVAAGAVLGFTVTGGEGPARFLFAATALVEVVAFIGAVRLRRRFDPSESAGLVWLFIALFLGIRLLAEARLATLYLGLADGWQTSAPGLHFFYTAGLRYLYTASDVLFGAALLVMLRTFRQSGLPFEARARDYVYVALLCLLPVGAVLLRHNLTASAMPVASGALQIFRVVATVAGTIVAGLCVIVRRYAVQLAGGLLGQVWSAVVVAGIAHAASFIVFAALSSRWPGVAELGEQLFLWIFAIAWLVALSCQNVLVEPAAAA